MELAIPFIYLFCNVMFLACFLKEKQTYFLVEKKTKEGVFFFEGE
jgi:hypothetical protein